MRIRSIILAGLCLLTLVSCDKLFSGDRAGRAVTFSASSDVTPLTKTSYSGVVTDGKERINWVDRDPVRMVMFSHDQNNRWGNAVIDTKTYYVVDIHDQGEKSVGKVAAASGFLTWQENKEHDFYSVYPSNFVGSTDIDGNNRKIIFTLPSAQLGDVSANMRYAYMAAIHEGYLSSGKGSVVLDYHPMVTTLHITLNNDTDAAIGVRSVRIKSSNQRLVGSYTVSSSGGTTPFSPQSGSETATSPEVSMVLNTTLQPGQTTNCVFFLMPTTFNTSELRFSIVTDNGVAEMSMENSGISQFLACKKYNLTFSIEERKIQSSELSNAMNTLCLFSDSPMIANLFDYDQTLGLVYQGTNTPISEDDLITALQQVTEISNIDELGRVDLLVNLTPADFTIFPNLKTINLTGLGNNNSFSVADLTNLVEIAYSGNATHLSIANCNFSQGDDLQPLVIKSTSYLDNISITNITGLKEIILQGGNNGGGNIGQVFIDNCPDLETIQVLQVGGEVPMKKAFFRNLGVKTIYIERANETSSIEVSDCPYLERLIVCKQQNWMLSTLSLTNCPVLGDAAPDDSPYGLTGLSIEKVAWNFTASKDNCPNLGPTLTTQTNNGQSTYVVTFRE